MADGTPAPEPTKLTFRPGINRETTNYGNTGGWYDGNMVRWKSGTPQSIGGWQRYTAEVAQGTFRSLFPFSVLSGSSYYGTGTNLKYYLVQGNALIDITPLRSTVTINNNPFAIASGSAVCTVTDTGHGAVLNDFVTFSGATTIGASNVTAAVLNQEYQITEIVDDNTYKITLSVISDTTSAGGGGASVVAEYQINVGLDTTAQGNGWGTGPWGANEWGEGSSTFVLTDQLRLWSEDTYGEDLLFNVRNGGIYYKDMSGSLSTRAVDLTSMGTDAGIPSIARQVLVSDNDRHVLAIGTNPLDSATQDRQLIRWSTSEDVTVWTPDTTNTAGELRINVGSEILRAVETTTEMLVFTDVSLHSVKYVGPPFTFGEVRLGANIHLIGPNAVVSTGSETYWMSTGLFQMYDGVVRDLPCDVRSYIFGILNLAQAEKIVAGINRNFKEVIWLLPVNGSTELNFYVCMNYEDRNKPIWYYGDFNGAGRTTWLDAWFENTPLAGAPDGYIYSQEAGATDNSSGAPVEMASYLQSSVFEIGTGGDFMLITRTIPDVGFLGSSASAPSVNITISKRDYPGSAFVDTDANPVTATVLLPVEQYTKKIDKRYRARSVDFKISSGTAGTAWQLGVPRIYASPDGQR